jgi:hypothetical protein
MVIIMTGDRDIERPAGMFFSGQPDCNVGRVSSGSGLGKSLAKKEVALVFYSYISNSSSI